MGKKPETIVVPDDKIIELRRMFQEKMERDGGSVPDGFDQRDIDRINNRKKWLQRFLEYNDLNMKNSLEQLWTTMIWRKKHNVNDPQNEKTVDLDIINAGLMFHRGVDCDGKRILIFKTKLYTRGDFNVENMKKNLIYYVERMYRETDMEQITAFFDMEGSGMSNMDLDYTRYIINLFKYYYPNSLNYILVYELPWVLTATFKIIKGLLPPKAVEAMKFVNKKNLKEYVSVENMQKCWGGTDDYTFKFTPQNPNVQILARDPDDDRNNNETMVSNKNAANGRKVHFANMSPVESPMSESTPLPGQQSKEEKRLKVLDEGIIFGVDAQEGHVDVENISDEMLIFKVKTTNPEKFRVSPTAGMIRAKQMERITVSMVHDHCVEDITARDKFLIMCKPLEDPSDDFVPIERIHKEFKQAQGSDIEQHRIRCIYPSNAGADSAYQAPEGMAVRATALRNGSAGMRFTADGDDRARQSNQDWAQTKERLEKQMKHIQLLQYILLAIIFVLVAMVLVYMPKFEADTLKEVCAKLNNEQQTTHGLPGKAI